MKIDGMTMQCYIWFLVIYVVNLNQATHCVLGVYIFNMLNQLRYIFPIKTN